LSSERFFAAQHFLVDLPLVLYARALHPKLPLMEPKEDHRVEDKNTGIANGLAVLQGHIARLPDTPGVYRMIAQNGEVLYIGKAKALKKRVSSYTQFAKLPIRLQRMVAQIASMEFVHTHTEAEALLLESNLIKKDKPRYNILLRDDKSFPYILIPAGHDFPLITKHRGARKIKGQYFGPFASAGDVNRTIEILQRVFMLRNCSDSYFAQRARPCLQYHIKRCTAPCVGMVSKPEYAAQAEEAIAFLEGKSRGIQTRMAKAMQDASVSENYEAAAVLRDRIRALTAIQAQQDINVEGLKNADIMALVQKNGRTCVQVSFFRAGRNYGNRAYFPRHAAEEVPEALLEAFIGQFYVNKPVPRELILSHAPPEQALLQAALSQAGEHAINITVPRQGARKRVIDFALKNAENALERHLQECAGDRECLEKLAAVLGMAEPPARIEVYDNSHISGTNMVGGMIVAGPEGLRKNAYRKFNIRMAEAGDDYGMMREVLTRRFSGSLKAEVDDSAEAEDKNFPDLVVIDGGKGQLGVAAGVLRECGVYDHLTLLAIAKGEDRNSGRETLYMAGRKPIHLKTDDVVLHYLQRLRDEAHRYAIGSHRTRRSMELKGSPLDELSGIGPRRKKALLLHFGSAKAVAAAGMSDLEKVEGISRAFAQKIYDHFQG
jgi:excinuclease ABC subunit C